MHAHTHTPSITFRDAIYFYCTELLRSVFNLLCHTWRTCGTGLCSLVSQPQGPSHKTQPRCFPALFFLLQVPGGAPQVLAPAGGRQGTAALWKWSLTGLGLSAKFNDRLEMTKENFFLAPPQTGWLTTWWTLVFNHANPAVWKSSVTCYANISTV